MPSDIPPLPKSSVRYKIDLQNNPQLIHIDNRDYFVNVSTLDVSKSGVELVNPTAWRNLVTPNIDRHILLSENRLISLPQDAITSVSISPAIRIALNNNPWLCSCENRWFVGWLTSINSSLLNANNILCDSPERLRGRNVLSVSEEEFCTDPVIAYVQKVLPTSVAAIFILNLFMCLAVYRWRVRIFVRWNFHPFDRDECVGEDMKYDVFLCCSYNDHAEHGIQILEELESKGFRVCYHLRDFTPGLEIMDNITFAVTHSKRTICLVSDNFLNR